jgi:hypothetical protein
MSRFAKERVASESPQAPTGVDLGLGPLASSVDKGLGGDRTATRRVLAWTLGITIGVVALATVGYLLFLAP